MLAWLLIGNTCDLAGVVVVYVPVCIFVAREIETLPNPNDIPFSCIKNSPPKKERKKKRHFHFQ